MRLARKLPTPNGRAETGQAILLLEFPSDWTERRYDLVTATTSAKMSCDIVRVRNIQEARLKHLRHVVNSLQLEQL
jgi:hypothetical protein